MGDGPFGNFRRAWPFSRLGMEFPLDRDVRSPIKSSTISLCESLRAHGAFTRRAPEDSAARVGGTEHAGLRVFAGRRHAEGHVGSAPSRRGIGERLLSPHYRHAYATKEQVRSMPSRPRRNPQLASRWSRHQIRLCRRYRPHRPMGARRALEMTARPDNPSRVTARPADVWATGPQPSETRPDMRVPVERTRDDERSYRPPDHGTSVL
jgi:hypothetical protein